MTARFDLGDAHPRHAPATGRRVDVGVGRSSTELPQRSAKGVDTGPALAGVEGLGQIKCGDNIAGADQGTNHLAVMEVARSFGATVEFRLR